MTALPLAATPMNSNRRHSGQAGVASKALAAQVEPVASSLIRELLAAAAPEAPAAQSPMAASQASTAAIASASLGNRPTTLTP